MDEPLRLSAVGEPELLVSKQRAWFSCTSGWGERMELAVPRLGGSACLPGG